VTGGGPEAKRQWALGLGIGLGVCLVIGGLGFLVTGRREAAPGPVVEAPVVDEAAIRAEAERQAQIGSLLAAGDEALEDVRLTTPEDDSAMYYYQQVLSLDPENEAAEDGIRNIVAKYVELAEGAAAQGNVSKANSYIDRAGSVSPNDPELIAARARLASMPRARSAPKPAAARYSSFRMAEADYRKGKMSKADYKGVVRDLKIRRDREIQYARGELVGGEIDKGEYKRRVRAIKERYQ